jgi:hypothetical protein
MYFKLPLVLKFNTNRNILGKEGTGGKAAKV